MLFCNVVYLPCITKYFPGIYFCKEKNVKSYLSNVYMEQYKTVILQMYKTFQIVCFRSCYHYQNEHTLLLNQKCSVTKCQYLWT